MWTQLDMASSNSKRFEEATEYINMIKFLEMLGIYQKELGSMDAMKEFARQHLSKDKHDIPKVQVRFISVSLFASEYSRSPDQFVFCKTSLQENAKTWYCKVKCG